MLKYIKLLRVKQWIKNLFVFAGIIFSLHFTDFNNIILTSKIFVTFCMIASAVYIINDSIDVEKDRNHPVNCKRPIASGEIGINEAILISILLLISSLISAYMINTKLFYIILSYFIMNLLYTFKLKQIVIIDVFIIAIGFVLRVLAGTVTINVNPSHWLLLCTFLLSLFLGFAKRRHELTLMGTDNEKSRVVLSKYSTYFLDQMLAVITPSVFLSYVLYTVDSETIAKYHGKQLIYTTPFVIYGIFRYQYLVYEKKEGNPSKIVFQDISLIVNVVVWLVLFLYLAEMN